MKATLLTSAIALCALTALAADQKTTDKPAAAADQKPAETVLSVAPQAGQQDSPLVAAAKRTGRLGKTPENVITNDTLLKSGGHFTTTKSQAALPDSPALAQAETAGKPGATDKPITTNNKATAPATAKPAETPKKQGDAKSSNAKDAAIKRAVADYMGESIENVNEDPAAQEGVVTQGVAPKPAEKPAAPKPPSE